ncbi:hypothetical protein AB1Y20_003642 [Prymnesium parvum]|uniref:8-oxo-dGTP diphosphatase n=1 Tax=Prymnesium parvum TaxID=97485 RepID=A0AB34J7T8_PRYPA
MGTKSVLVVAAALVRAPANEPRRVLLAQRPAGKEMGLLWEFPGGKVEEGETPEQALVRELKEELAIDVDPSTLAPLTFASHSYTSGTRKPFHLLMPLYACVDGWTGEPVGAEGQAVEWVTADSLDEYEYPPADIPLLRSVRALLSEGR